MNSNDEFVQKVFENALASVPEASPFTQTKVLAELDHRAAKRRAQGWRNLAIVTSLATAMMAIALVLPHAGRNVFEVKAHQPILVEVNIKNVSNTDIARAEIELPEGVTIYSVAHPEFNGLSRISVAWNPDRPGAAFPFIVKSEQTGLKRIKVKFLTRGNSVGEEKILFLNFLG